MGSRFNRFTKVMVVFCTITFFGIILIYRCVERALRRRYLSSITQSQIDAMDGYDFEKYIRVVLEDKGFRVIPTPERADYGADLIVTHRNIRCAIQCKLYYKHGVGVSAVQEVRASMPHYDATTAAVITNSHFTLSAVTLAENNGVTLIDRDCLQKIISPHTQKKDIAKIICQNMSQSIK